MLDNSDKLQVTGDREQATRDKEMGAPHRNLIVWQKAIKLTVDVYAITNKFPDEEKYGLTPQLRRAAVSVASNIAEGCARYNNQEKIQFFLISRGSISEIETQIEISCLLKYLNIDKKKLILEKLEEINRLLNGLIKSRRRN